MGGLGKAMRRSDGEEGRRGWSQMKTKEQRDLRGQLTQVNDKKERRFKSSEPVKRGNVDETERQMIAA